MIRRRPRIYLEATPDEIAAAGLFFGHALIGAAGYVAHTSPARAALYATRNSWRHWWRCYRSHIRAAS